MILWRLLLPLPVLLVASCGGPIIEEDPTIQQLAQRAAKIKPAELPPMSRVDVKNTYESLAKTTKNESLKAMALQRLADLELESKQEAIANVAQSDKPEKTDANTGRGASVDNGSQDTASAIKQYERLLQLYPDYIGSDKVLYQLGRAYELNGDLEKTLATLTRLITQYPRQKNRDELQFRRGEILFAFKEFKQAEVAYQDVINIGQGSAYYDRAMFKRGWSIFKQGDTRRSLDSYFAVLDKSFAGGRDISDFNRSELELLEDTLRIVSISFSYLKGPDSVKSFFDTYGTREYEFRIYERLGDLYLSQDRTTDATDTFYKFIELYPEHRFSPLFMVKLIDIYKNNGRKKELLRAKADLITVYGVGTAFWRKIDNSAKNQLLPHIKQNLEDLTRYYHAEAQKTKLATDYRLAAHWYRTYVRSFPGDPSAPEKHMLLAETLQESGDIKGAAIEYEYTAYVYPPHKKSAEAGYAALLMHRKLIDFKEGKASNKDRLEAIAIGKRFVTTFPDDRRAVSVMSKAAEELLSLKDYRQAVNTAYHVVSTRPAPEKSLLRINWAIIAEGEFAMADYPEAEIASQKRIQLADQNDSDRHNFTERLAAAIYKQGEIARDNNDYREAARHFLRLGKVVPDASIRATAEFDAAAALVTIKEWKLAIPVLEAFVQQHPDHKLRPDADQNLALAYEKSEDWVHAAVAYKVLYEDEKDQDKKRLILWQTAELYKKANQTDKVIETFKQYVSTFPMPFNEAIEARNNLATIYKEKGETESRAHWLKELVKADKEGPSTDRSKYLAANAMYELAIPAYQSYRKVKLVQPLKENLKKKKALMQESIQAYTDAADYGIEAITTASTYRIAEIYNEFSRGLYNSERPQGLTGEEKEQYEILLEEQAFPFEEKAIEIHEVNALRVTSGIYDRWVKESFAALTKLNPIRYAKDEKGAQASDVIF